MIRSAFGVRQSFLPVLLLLSGCTEDATQDAGDARHSAVNEVVEDRVEVFLQEMIDQEHFSGVALVAKGGEVIHAKGYGIAAGAAPNNVDTVFHVASVTKQFTAAAIMQLVEAGILTLDESINAYLPARYVIPTWNDVHVQHLLSHSSGITDYAVVRDYYEVVDGFCLGETVDGMIREAMSKELEFAPGSEFAYSNIGFTLLGEIIEEQAGIPFARYMKEKILEPMGMHSSRIHIEGHVPADNEAAGHRWDEDTQRHVKDDVVSLPVTEADGGLVTTLGDFLKWIRIYSGGGQDILRRSSIDAMTTSQISMGRSGSIDGYGYGIGVGQRLIGHSGYIVGFRSRFDYDRQSGTLIAIFTNNTTNDPARISSGLLTIMLTPES
jgi:CubicO group peptidase (beta-lactamase class C family)